MAKKKKAPNWQGIQLPTATPLTASGLEFQAGSGFYVGSTVTVGFDDTPIPPEPKEEPKTVVGLTGYRLYTLDNELYLRGQQGNRQEGRESKQAKHNEDLSFSGTEAHPAPAWGCLCGFAAFFWPTSLGQPAWGSVLAEVQAGGRAIYCEQGWRAERIVLNKLWVSCPIFPDAALEILQKRYEVPVELL